MNIGIITVYESIDNFGSYLQAYTLKKFLESRNNNVYIIQNRSISSILKKYLCKINPKREFFLRLKKGLMFILDNKKLNIVNKNKVLDLNLDLLIYGSDEIWNLENPYFRNNFFWGGVFPDIPKIAYAVSIGDMKFETEEKYNNLYDNLSSFKRIMVRDERTSDFVNRRICTKTSKVCDPTMLIPIRQYSKTIDLPKKKYLFIYTYGVNLNIEKLIKIYAKRHGLYIVSACFWHAWADITIECSPLQLSSLIVGADCVFTSTFHGALITMLNHKRCCIFPTREKVQNIVYKMGMEDRLIDDSCTEERFEYIMRSSFEIEDFEDRLLKWRLFSIKELENSLQCFSK